MVKKLFACGVLVVIALGLVTVYAPSQQTLPVQKGVRDKGVAITPPTSAAVTWAKSGAPSRPPAPSPHGLCSTAASTPTSGPGSTAT
jgi:hypothetical protein